jgi:hypothetical protein
MHSSDANYLLVRAEQELERARKADHPAAVRAHYHLAGYYLDRAHNERSSPAPRLGNRSC